MVSHRTLVMQLSDGMSGAITADASYSGSQRCVKTKLRRGSFGVKSPFYVRLGDKGKVQNVQGLLLQSQSIVLLGMDMKNLILCGLAIGLVGCAVAPKVAYYKNEGQSEEELFSITSLNNGSLFSNIPSARLIRVIDQDGKEVIGEKDFLEYVRWETAYIQPGKYTLEFRCTLGEDYSLPKVEFEAAKGQHFVYQCESVIEKVFGIPGVVAMNLKIEESSTPPEKG